MEGKRSAVGMRLELISGPAIELPPTLSAASATTIGRAESNDICLLDSSVSRRHASVCSLEGHWFVTDLESRHGTYLNTIRIEPGEETELSDQDSLRIGSWLFQVVIEGQEQRVHSSDAGEAELHQSVDESNFEDTFATRATIFLRLRADQADIRELSWQEFADRYQRVIIGFARNYGLPDHEAQDVLQDVLLGFFRVSGRFEYDPARGRFRGYLKRITLNAIRSRNRRLRPELRSNIDKHARDAAQPDTLWNREWTSGVLERALNEAAGQFQASVWQAFELYGRRGVPCEEVARQLNMTPESVRKAKSRIAIVVRQIINRIREDEG